MFLGVLQTEQKHIGKCREAKEVEMNISQSETYLRPSGTRYLVDSTMALKVQKPITVDFKAVDVRSTMTIVNQGFSVPKCVRLARMSEKFYELFCKMFRRISRKNQGRVRTDTREEVLGIC